MGIATRTTLPEGYKFVKHGSWTFQWQAPDGRVGFKTWDRELVIYSAHKDAEDQQG